MAKQFRVNRKVATIPVAAGGFATIDLPRQYDMECIFLRLSGSVQVTAAATAVRAEAPVQYVPRIEVIADGKNNLYSAPFWFTTLGSYDRKLTDQGARVTTPPSGTAIATYTFETFGTVDFQMVDGVRPKDSNFRTAGLSLFQLRATFGNPGDIFVGGTCNFVGTPTLEVFVQEDVEIPDKDGNVSSPSLLKKVSYQEIALIASNANQEVRLPAGNYIKSAVFRTEGAVTAGEPSVAVLNNLQLAAGVDVRWNLTGPQTRAKNNADFGYVPTGYYITDVTAKGSSGVNLTDMWDVTNQAEPKAILDVVGSATTKMQVVITECIPAS